MNETGRARLRLVDEALEPLQRDASLATAGASQVIAERAWNVFEPAQTSYNLLATYGDQASWSGIVEYDTTKGWSELIGVFPNQATSERTVAYQGVPLDVSQWVTSSVMPYVYEGVNPAFTTWVNSDPVAVYQRTRVAADESRGDALSRISDRLDVATATYSQSQPREVLDYVSDVLGVAQLVIARALGVTPTAVRKWRRGEAARPEHRGALARFAGMCSLLTELGLHDPAGWLDIPISSRSVLTPLDLFIAGRSDLSVLLGSLLAAPQEVLDDFDAEWRDKYAVDPDYEIVVLGDGSRSAVPRRRDS